MAQREGLIEKAQKLKALHRPGHPLVLLNAWDAATARVIEESGAEAIATTSAGIAFAHGYPDGERISRDLMLDAISIVCSSVSVPVTADVEAGYGPSPEDVRATVRGVLDAGAVGVNLEDGGAPGGALVELPRQVEKIRAARDEAARRGVHLVVNARTDVYLDRIGPESGRLDETVRRGAGFRDAGADCVFVPGVTDPETIRAIVERLGCPVNVLAVSGGPSIPQLARLGVARVSLGSGPMRAALSLMQRLAAELRDGGTYSALEGILSHASVNALMERRAGL